MDSAPASPAIPEPSRPGWRQRVLERFRDPKKIGVYVLVGVAAFFLGRFYHKSKQETLKKYYDTTNDVIELYKLQFRYKIRKGTFANDLDSLLSVTPDAAARKAKMAEHMDMSTLTVVGNVKKFKIEANVLVPERPLVRLRGPIPYNSKEPTVQTDAPVTPTKDGAPIAPVPTPAPAPGR